MSDALARFADNEGGLLPAHVYSGPCGASSQLQHIAAWFQVRARGAWAQPLAKEQPGTPVQPG